MKSETYSSQTKETFDDPERLSGKINREAKEAPEEKPEEKPKPELALKKRNKKVRR